MVVNVNKLNIREMHEYKRLYISYFRSILKNEKDDRIYKILTSLKFSKSEKHAKKMIDLIKSNERIGFVSLKGFNRFNGFITGRIYDDCGWISHFYIKPELNPKDRKKVALELYKEMALEFQNLGVNKIQTEIDDAENQLIDLFMGLGFEESTEIEDGVSIYERKI